MTVFTRAVWEVLLELAPWLLVGTATAGLMHVFLPRGFIERHLRGRGGVLRAVLLGVPLPLCSCGVIPAGLGLKRDGASNGAAVGFLISTPQTGVDSVLVSAAFLGWPFALFKVVSAFVLGVVGGLWTDRVDPGLQQADAQAAEKPQPSFKDGLAHSLDMLRTIWRWLVFGVLISAAITTFLPPNVFASMSAYGGALAMAAMLLIALPLYVCATASVPIAAALIAGGFPPGAALVFLMAGPATNLATVGAVRRAFGNKTLAIYLATIAVGSVALGMAFDSVLALGVPEAGPAAQAAAETPASPLAIAATVVFLLLVARFAFDDARTFLRRRRSAADQGARAIEVGVDGLTCNGCVRKLETQLRELPDVGSVEVLREPKGVARVSGVGAQQLHDAIREAGFRPL